MSDTNVVDFVTARDQAIWDARLSGRSVRSIGREFNCHVHEVEAVIARMVTPVTLEMKLRELELDISRVNKLFNAYYQKALAGDPTATGICIRLLEHRSHLLGFQPPVRVDPIQIRVEAHAETSTDRIERALKLVVEHHKPNGGDPDPDPPSSPPVA